MTFLLTGVVKDLRDSLYKKIVSLPISYYSEKKKGDVIARISGDVNEVKNSLLAVLELIVKEPLTIIFAILAMFLISVRLTVFVLLFIPVAGFIISIIGKSRDSKIDRPIGFISPSGIQQFLNDIDHFLDMFGGFESIV